jgi:histone H3/H4
MEIEAETFTRQQLNGFSRANITKLCKRYGIKAVGTVSTLCIDHLERFFD